MPDRKKLQILFCASEIAPFARTGGLGEAVGALPLVLEAEQNCDLILMMPRYRGILPRQKNFGKNSSIYFVEHESYFNRASLYGNEGGDYPDNLERFLFFCQRALSLSKEIGFKPNIIHAHDWQTALIPVLLKTRYKDDNFFKQTKGLLTVHNLGYQGVFSPEAYGRSGLPANMFTMDHFEFFGNANVLKAGIIFADWVNTVSPNYAKEIQTEGFGLGLEGVLKKRKDRLSGILNGIDDSWDPSTDAFIKQKYSLSHPEGKCHCKTELQKSCGFPVTGKVPLFGMVTRLAEQKGIDLLLSVADRLLAEKKAQFVLLGDGDGLMKMAFKRLAAKYPTQAAVYFGYEVAQAHRIYAGCDFFLMPSFFEPCGLGPMIALKYGTLPIARSTGGLVDTIVGFGKKNPQANGFLFDEMTAESFFKAVELAMNQFDRKETLKLMQQTAMRSDFSWRRPGHAYRTLYDTLLQGN